MVKIRNSMDDLSSRVKETEERTSELRGRTIEISPSGQQRK